MATTYDAFISYSHAADGTLAPTLQAALQGFAKPWYKRRALHLFRDQTSLSATPGLWPSIEQALKSSRYFLLLASPEAAQSRWVQQEVAWWLEHKSPQTLLIALTDGKIARHPGAKDFDWEATDALPPNLEGVFVENPLWVDFRWAQGQEHLSPKNPEFQNALAALAAPLRNVDKEDLIGEDIRQHRRALLLARGAAVVLVVLLVAAIGAAFLAVRNQAEAETQRNIAVAQRDRAEEQARLATSQRLAAEALGQLDERPDLGLLLSAQAYRIDDSFEASDSLLAALESNPYLTMFLRGHSHGVDDVAFSPDGRTLASSGCGKSELRDSSTSTCTEAELRLWDVATGEALAAPMTGPAKGSSRILLAFSPDGRTLASTECEKVDQDDACVVGAIRLWDVQKRQPIDHLLVGHAGYVQDLAFSPNGDILATGGGGDIVLWDVANRRPRGEPLTLEGLNGLSGIITLTFSPDGDTLVAGGARSTRAEGGAPIRRWDVATRELIGEPLVGHDQPVLTLAFSPDGTTMASGGADGIFLWDVATWQPLGEPMTAHPAVQRVAFAPDGKTLVSSGYGGTTVLWDLATRQPIGQPIIGHTDFISDLDVSRDGRFATSSWDRTVILGDLNAPSRLFKQVLVSDLYSFETHVSEPELSPDGTTVAVGGCGAQDRATNECIQGEIRLWDVATGQPLGEPLTGHGSVVSSLAFSADGSTMVSVSSWDRTAILWDVGERRARGAPLSHPNGILHAALSPDGRFLATMMGPYESGIVLWDTSSDPPAGETLPGSAGAGGPLTFSPSGDILAGGVLRRVVLWDVATRQVIGTPLDPATDNISGLVFSPHGSMLATAGQSMAMVNAISFEVRNNIILWDVQAHSRLATLLPRSKSQIRGLSFGPDGRLLASGSLDAGIMVWDVAARRPLRTPLVSPATNSRPVGFLPDGNSLLAVGCLRNGDVGRCTQDALHAWDVSPVTWQERACGVARRNLTPDEWRRFVSETLPYEPTCQDFPAGEDPVSASLVPSGTPSAAAASPEPAHAASSQALAPAATGAAVPATPIAVSTLPSGGGSSGVAGTTYTSPTYGYGLSWDASRWTVGDELSENGDDWLSLDSSAGFVSLRG